MKNAKNLFFYYVTNYLDIYLKNQLGRSDDTINSYRSALSLFRKYVYNVEGISIMDFKVIDCNKDLVLRYVEHLRIDKVNSTINHRVTVIKRYLWYVSDIDITYQSLAIIISHIPSLRVPKKVKECLNDEMLLAMFSTPKNTKTGIRNRTIMILLFDTAVRISELVTIKHHQLFLDATEPHIYIYGKGDKERIVPISEQALAHIKHYLSIFHKNDISDYLFYTVIKGESNHISDSAVETFIQKYADVVREEIPSMPIKVYPHMFRRSRATKLYQEGIPLELVARLLGHTSTETTKLYATPSIKMMRKAVIDDDLEKTVAPEWSESEDEIVKLFGLR